MQIVPDVSNIKILFSSIEYSMTRSSFAVGGGYIVDICLPSGVNISAELSSQSTYVANGQLFTLSSIDLNHFPIFLILEFGFQKLLARC